MFYSTMAHMGLTMQQMISPSDRAWPIIDWVVGRELSVALGNPPFSWSNHDFVRAAQGLPGARRATSASTCDVRSHLGQASRVTVFIVIPGRHGYQ